MANFKIKLSRIWIRDKTKARSRLDTGELKDPEAIKTYHKTRSNLLDNNLNGSNQSLKYEWKQVKEAINRAP